MHTSENAAQMSSLNTFTMSVDDAITELKLLSYGTLATLTGESAFTKLDEHLDRVIERVRRTDISSCRNWSEVWSLCYLQ